MHAVKTLAIMNQKGGVAKTTTAANLGAAIAMRGRSTLLIDLDPQCHLSLHFNVDSGDEHPTMYDLLVDGLTMRDVARQVGDRLVVAPASVDLAGVETQLTNAAGREQRLRRCLAEYAKPDFVIVDCPPSLGLLTLNALAAADEVIIPLQPHFLALQGLGQLLQTVSLVQQRINPALRVSGVVLCMFERITRLANEVVIDLQQFFQTARTQQTPWSAAKVFETVIRRNIKLAEAPSHGLSIFDYDPSSNGAKDYAALAEEFLEMHDAAGAADADSASPSQPSPAPPPPEPAEPLADPADP